jgi:uncharacterized protein (DUF983 family)
MMNDSSSVGEARDKEPFRPSLGKQLWRAVRLCCPVCGQGRLFRNWFTMHPQCNQCGFHFERGPGYWLGSIYVNYGLTALVVTAGYLGLFFSEAIGQTALLWLSAGFCLLFPLCFFRYARAVWIAVDLYFDPPRAEEMSSGTSAISDEVA